MQVLVLTCIQVLFTATTTTITMYAILDLILLNADTDTYDVSTHAMQVGMVHGKKNLTQVQ